MLHKTATKLFLGAYQYKIVLICAGASVFRNNDISSTIAKLDKVDIAANIIDKYRTTKIRSKEDLAYAFQLAATLKRLGDRYTLRVESPWISIYTNDRKIVNTLAKLDENKVKYISMPPDGVQNQAGTVIMSKRDYDYKVTLGRTHNENSAFIQWAGANPTKVKLTKGCQRDLTKDNSWGGSHFYISGENMLLVAKMHLGGCISKVERIIKK